MIDRNTLSMRLRRKQEELRQVIDDGYFKTFIEFQSVIFKEYLKRGFTREEALELLIIQIQHSQWNLEPDLGGTKGVCCNEEDDGDQEQI